MSAPVAHSPEQLILIADDDACFRRSLAIALRLEGFGVVEAADGEQALESVRQHRFNLVVIDQWLGIDRGDTVLQAISQLSPGTRLVATSDHPEVGCAMAACGLATRIEKPVRPSDIIALL